MGYTGISKNQAKSKEKKAFNSMYGMHSMVYDDDYDTPSGLTAAFVCEEGNPRRINEDKCEECGDQDVGECGNCDEHCICEKDEDHEE